MSHWTYVFVLAACLGAAAPLHIVFELRIFQRLNRLMLALVPGFVLFLGWDVYAIQAGQWSYDSGRTVDITLPGGVPIEEALFFVIVPLCAVLTYEAVGKTLTRLRAEPARPQQPRRDYVP